MRSTTRIALAVLTVSMSIVVVQPGNPTGPAEKTAPCPDLDGTYSLEGVSVRGSTASLTFAFRVRNLGGSPAEIEEITLANLANTSRPYLRVKRTRLAIGEELALTRRIRVPVREYERWEKGTAPRLHLRLRRHFAQDPCARAQIDLDRKESSSTDAPSGR